MPGDEAQPRNAVGIIGRIEPFEDTVETWTSYTERLEQYFEVNDIAEDKKVPALLINIRCRKSTISLQI